MDEIKAITTYYNGFKFRSRLEARWAVFFDAANIRYEYEPEGIKLNNGMCYLPDFYLPDEDMYVEVKPPRKGAWKDINKASRFVGNGINCLLLLPNIPPKEKALWYFPIMYWHPVEYAVKIKWCPICPVDGAGAYIAREIIDPIQNVCVPAFDYIEKEAAERWAASILEAHKDTTKFRYEDAFLADEDYEQLGDLFDKARQARFEFGEKG